jgi:uncharacterized membrane protein
MPDEVTMVKVLRAALAGGTSFSILKCMYRIIGGDGREYGPVSAAQIVQWIAQKRAAASTQVRPEGADTWVTLGELQEFAGAFDIRSEPPPLPPPALPPPLPSAQAELQTSFVAQPKPASEPTKPWQLSVLDCLDRGWKLVFSSFWPLVWGTIIAAATNAVVSSLPVVGTACSLLLTQVFYAGIFWMMLSAARGEGAEASRSFAGFHRAFRPLVQLSVFMSLSLFALVVVACGPVVWVLYRDGVFSGAPVHWGSLLGPAMLVPFLLIPAMYLSVSWTFAPLLVIDQGLGFAEALSVSWRLTRRRWFRLLLLHLTFPPLAVAGLLFFFVGFFVSLALWHAAISLAYQDLLNATLEGEPVD